MMGTVKTDAIVLRYANYGESNRMLTLLSPTEGLLSISARGCRKVTSRMLTACELFTAGEYMLYQKGEHYTLSSFQLQENYYPIREDIDKLSHGVYWLNLCEAAAQPGEACERLFKMLLLSLAVLAYDHLPPRALTAVFLMQFSLLQGFVPQLDRCSRCGNPLTDAPMRFDPVLGGICCGSCASASSDPIDPAACAWLREARDRGAFVLAGRRPLPQPDHTQAAEQAFALMRQHVEFRLEKHISSGKFL